MDFTGKYYTTPAKFVRMKGSGIEITDEGLAGKAVGVQRATIHENFLRDNYGDIVDIKAYATQDEANLDFGAGRVDLLLADSMALQGGFLDTPDGGDAEFVGPDFTDPQWFGDGAGIAVRKGETGASETRSTAPSRRSAPTAPTRRSTTPISTSTSTAAERRSRAGGRRPPTARGARRPPALRDA